MTTFKTAVTLLLVSISPASYAGDDKTYPGSFCQPLLTEDPVPDGAEVVCPIMRDNTENENGLQLAIVRVFNNDGRIECTLQSESAGGRVIAKKTASIDLMGVQSLNVTVKASMKGGVYNMHCVLPCLGGRDPFCGTGIISYRILEY